MTTNTLPSFSAASPHAPWEPAYFIRFPHEGTVYSVGFDSLEELKKIVADHCVYPGEYVISFAEESLEWNAAPPVAEAATDEPCQCDARRLGHNALLIAELQSDMRSQERRVTWALIVIGIVAWFV